MCQVTINDEAQNKANKAKKTIFKKEIVWHIVALYIYVHLTAFYSLYQFICAPNWPTFIWTYFMLVISFQGIVSGTHRLWSHRSYKAKLPLELYLALCQTIAFQGNIYHWVRDHRTHHKFVDSDADPHNINRGFFFAQIGWTMVKKHPDVVEKGKQIDMSDLLQNPVVMFQKSYFFLLAPICCFVLPALIPWYFWAENFWLAWNIGVFRYMLCIHFIGTINSVAHTFGTRPYDKHQKATESTLVAHLTQGDGCHNYHHAFPWDYKGAELDKYSGNINLMFIHLMAKIGWAYDLRTASPEMIERQCRKRGDQSRPIRYVH